MQTQLLAALVTTQSTPVLVMMSSMVAVPHSQTPPCSLIGPIKGCDGTDIFAGFTQDTGGIDVAVSFTNGGVGMGATVEADATYVDTGEPFDLNSCLGLRGSGTGMAWTTALDFSSVAGSGLFASVENVIPCFCPDSVVSPLTGPKLVEDLQIGDHVLTRDNGYKPICWIGRKSLDTTELARRPQMRPIHIAQGALGKQAPV